jgi:4-amino-4-deoxy-L-arabinose transferase-like glycosyltransferase
MSVMLFRLIKSRTTWLLMVPVALSLALYPIDWLHEQRIYYLPVLQYIYLVVAALGVYPWILLLLRSVYNKPRTKGSRRSDRVWLAVVILGLLLGYAGMAVHAVTKTLSTELRDEASRAAEMNRFYHLTFSHNLIYSSIAVVVFGITMLELNRFTEDNEHKVAYSVMIGLMLAILLFVSLIFYTRSTDAYSGRWSDLRLFYGLVGFGVVWLTRQIRKTNFKLKNSRVATALWVMVLSLMLFLLGVWVLR